MAGNNNKRSNNFSKNEERILLDIVYKHKEIIECKKTDTVMNRKKVEIWVGITKEFNAVSGETFRDAKTLKNKYENLKKRTKHKAAEERQALLRTGGGPYIESKMDSTETKILDLLGVRAKGMQSEFGDDTISFPIPQETVSARDISATGDDTSTVILLETEQDIPETFTIDGPSTSSENNREDVNETNENNWAKYTPDMLSQPKSKPLQIHNTPKKNTLGVKLEKWAASKSDFENLKMRCCQEEHDLKMQHLREIHAKQMEVLSIESEQRMVREKEKHDIEIEILKNKLQYN